jgi:hypothetical protein
MRDIGTRTRGPGRIGTVVALGLLICLLAPSGASAAEKALWGPVRNELPGQPNNSAFPLYQRLGVDTLQMQLRWERVARRQPADPTNPADPAYEWPANVDEAYAEASRRGIRLALLVTGAPGWANGGDTWSRAPEHAGTYAAFLSAASKRYSGVRRWMIWGEPNMPDKFRTPGSKPQKYAELLDAAYVALKRRSRRNMVIGGMTWTGGRITGGFQPVDWVRQMRLPNGRAPRLDWYGHNPMPFRQPNLRNRPIAGGWRDMSDLNTFGREVQRSLRRRGGPRIPFWLSEFTVPAERALGWGGPFTQAPSEAGQARWLTAGYRVADQLGSQVRGMGWFTLIDRAGNPWGLIKEDGSPRPSLSAFRAAPSARFTPRVRVGRTARRATLARPGLRVAIDARRSGRILVQLRCGSRVVRSTRVTPRNRRAAVRLRHARAARGTYQVLVRAPGGETVTRSVRVR